MFGDGHFGHMGQSIGTDTVGLEGVSSMFSIFQEPQPPWHTHLCVCVPGGMPYYRGRPAWVQGWALSGGGGAVPGGCHHDCTGPP